MTSQIRKTRSSRRNRVNAKYGSWILGFMVLAFAALIIAGPKLFAQNASASATNKTMALPASGANAKSSASANMVMPVTGANAETSGTAMTMPAGSTQMVPQRIKTILPVMPPATAALAKPTSSEAGGEAIQLPFSADAYPPLFIVLFAAVLALFCGWLWLRKTMKVDPGSERMQGVAAAVQEGAMAYLSRQVKTMIPLVIVIAVGLFFLYKGQYAFMEAKQQGISLILGFGVALAFIAGVTASYLAGYVGMGVAVRANVRVANAALSSFKIALETAFQAGAVSGMFTVGLGLLGATITFMIFKENAMFVLVGFGFGG